MLIDIARAGCLEYGSNRKTIVRLRRYQICHQSTWSAGITVNGLSPYIQGDLFIQFSNHNMEHSHSSTPSGNQSKSPFLHKIIDEIKARCIQSAGELEFITESNLKEIWTKPRIEELFDRQAWICESISGQPILEYVRQNLLKVLSILVYIEWIDLTDFNLEFVSHVDDKGRWNRQDKDLPLDIRTIGHDHNANTLARDFRRDQYKFIPIIIKERGDEDYPTENYVLPFCNGAKVIGEGSFFKVYKTTIPCGQFKSFWNGTLNLKVQVVPF